MSTKFRAEISVLGPIGEESVPQKRPHILQPVDHSRIVDYGLLIIDY